MGNIRWSQIFLHCQAAAACIVLRNIKQLTWGDVSEEQSRVGHLLQVLSPDKEDGGGEEKRDSCVHAEYAANTGAGPSTTFTL